LRCVDVLMDYGWPIGYEKKQTLTITTIGRRSGKRHDTTIWFAVDDDERVFIWTRDPKRDWVRNVLVNPTVEIRMGGVTRKMTVVPLKSDAEKEHLANLCRKKYLRARIGSLFAPRSQSQGFELKPK
jgi:deazaflavin-dependent oxidoreductase (nitroreductase family)